jgi:lysozyme family protein
MSDFNTAILVVLANEGGYANNSQDIGGETFCGISRTFHPEWVGWNLVDTFSDKSLAVANPALQSLVRQFYYANFWKFEAVVDNRVAAKLLDSHVDTGSVIIRIVQSLVGVAADGVWGPQTETAVNAANGDVLLSKMRRSLIGYRFDKVAKEPKQVVFLRGWVLRDAQ